MTSEAPMEATFVFSAFAQVLDRVKEKGINREKMYLVLRFFHPNKVV